MNIHPIVLAGGRETSLWPLSRAGAPKQFVRVSGEQTLFQATLKCLANPDIYEPPTIVTSEDFRFVVSEQARELGVTLAGTLLEPVARNTASAIAAAATWLLDRYGPDAVMQVLVSDHEIVADQGYFDAIRFARDAAVDGKLVAFGVAPTEPATGYSYIQAGEQIGPGTHVVRRFIEKPSLKEAERMLATGSFYWNSGILMFTAGQIMAELETHAPEVASATREAVAMATADLDFTRLKTDAFARSPDITIDYALMEKTSNAVVVPSSFRWSGLGSWNALWKLGTRDGAGNLVSGNVTLMDTKNSIILSRTSHLAVQGLENAVVIASEDAVYVGRREESQNVDRMVKRLAATAATASLSETHPTSYRPWGGYTSVLKGDRYQVKRLFVTPGKKLTLQKHHHRSEHWVCVKGTAEVTIGKDVKTVRENESVYIPQGEAHRLANPGKMMLEMIEVQTGSYIGEDDIIRIVDEFGRS